MRRVAGALGLIGIVAAMASPARAAITATHSAGAAGGVGTVTVTGDGANDNLGLHSFVNGLVTHNSHPGFNSNSDFDSTLAGDQTLPLEAGSAIIFNANGGNDGLVILPPNTFPVNVTYDAGAGTLDTFQFTAQGGGLNRSASIGANTMTGLIGGTIQYANFESGTIDMGGGDDTVTVTATPGAPLSVRGQTGDDTLALGDGTSLGATGEFLGSAGSDTLDYSAWTTPVMVNLGVSASFFADLDGGQEVPPVVTAATGGASVFFPDLSTNTFDFSLEASGLTDAEITDSHIHAAAPGVNGPVIFPIGAGTSWNNPGIPAMIDAGRTDPDITEPALRDGNTYFNIHTGANPGGEIRGRILLDTEYGYRGTAPGLPAGVAMVENVIGGSAADQLAGSPASNRIVGNGGTDELLGKDGVDTVVANDGAADLTIDCGGGNDAVVLDAADLASNCPPHQPTGLSVDPASPSTNLGPRIKGTADAGTTVKVFAGSTPCSGTPVGTGSAADFAGAGIAVTAPVNALTTFSAAASNADGDGACSGTVTYQTIEPIPAAPTGLTTSPVSPNSSTKPRIRGTAAAGSTVTIHADAACQSAPVAQGTAAAFADPGLEVTVAEGSTTTFYAAATSTGGKGPCSTVVTYQQVPPVLPPIMPPILPPTGTISELVPKAGGGAQITIGLGSAACPAAATATCSLVSSATSRVPLTAFTSAKAKTRRVTLGKRTIKIAPGKARKITLRLSKKNSALWRRAKTLRIKFTTRLTVPGGKTVRRSRTVTLKAPKRT
jgi:hypothetical protein